MRDAGQRTLLVLTAVRAELRAVLGPLGAEAPEECGRVVAARAGALGILAGHTGVGPVNAAFCLGRLLGEHGDGIDGVVNLGVAGSFDLEALPLGATLTAARETWPEFGLWTAANEGGAPDPSGIGFAQLDGPAGPVYASMSLAPREAALRMGLALPGWSEAHVLTVAGVSGHSGRGERLRRLYGADAECMEGFALALGAARAGLPFLEVRTVSNLVGSRPPRNWDLRGALSALEAASGELLGRTGTAGGA